MASLPEVSAAPRDAGSASPRLLHRGRAIGLFLGIMAVLTGILVLTLLTHRTVVPGAKQQRQQRSEQSGSFALTNEEALAKFRELNGLRLQAYAERDPSVIAQILAANSPLRPKAYSDIARLHRDRVMDRTHFSTRGLRVLANGPNKVVLRQVEVQKPRFVSESGHDLSQSHHPIVVTIDWTLRRNGYVWRIFDSSVVRAHRLRPHG
jgi:hypothetical protein